MDEKITFLVKCSRCESGEIVRCNRGFCSVCMARNICMFRRSKTIRVINTGEVCWRCELDDMLIIKQHKKPKPKQTNNFPYNKHKRKKKRRKRNGRNIQSKNTSVSSMQAN